MQHSQLLTALKKNYEERNIKEHRLIFKAIANSFSAHSQEKTKMMTFYLEVREGPVHISANEYSKHSFVLKFNEDICTNMQLITSKGVQLYQGEFVCILDYHRYLNVQALGDSSIQKEISFWQSSQYFCSMPKKKIYQLLRQSQIRVFKQNELTFFQGQLMTKTQSGSGVFVVRKGEFGYYRVNNSKEIQTFRFQPGSIFGTLQIIQNDTVRTMTARCKTQKSIIYHLSEELFRRLMMRYCEAVVLKKQAKLLKYSQNKPLEMVKSKSLSESLRKTKQFNDKQEVKPLMMTTNFQSAQSLMLSDKRFPRLAQDKNRTKNCTAFRESLRIENEGMKRTDYFSLRKDGPLKNYPLASQRSNFASSEFKVLQKLFQAKKEVGKEDLFQSTPIRQNGVWRRDMIHSFYRQSFFQRVKKNPEV